MIEAWKDRGRLHIRFSDEGGGIPVEALESIFINRFSLSQDELGREMDLENVYSVVTQRLGGAIDCYNEEGNRCVFTIILPSNEPEPLDKGI